MNRSFTDDENVPIEGDVAAVAGSTLYITCVFLDADTCSSTSATVWVGNENVTATLMPSGTVTETDNTATLKPITAMTGGYTYTVEVTTTLDGVGVTVKKFNIVVSASGAEA